MVCTLQTTTAIKKSTNSEKSPILALQTSDIRSPQGGRWARCTVGEGPCKLGQPPIKASPTRLHLCEKKPPVKAEWSLVAQPLGWCGDAYNLRPCRSQTGQRVGELRLFTRLAATDRREQGAALPKIQGLVELRNQDCQTISTTP